MKYTYKVFLCTFLFSMMFFAQIAPVKPVAIEIKTNQAQTLIHDSDAFQQKAPNETSAAKLPDATSDLFYLSHWNPDTYQSHLQSNPAVTDIFLSGVLPTERLNEGTMDNNGNWWGIDLGFTKFYKINLETKVITLVSDNINGFLKSCVGITYNTHDDLLYFITYESGTTDLYSLSPSGGAPVFVRTYPFSSVGLACSNGGALYAYGWDGNVHHLYTFTAGAPGFSDVGIVSIPGVFLLGYLPDLEIDPKTDKCYLISQNVINSHWVMNEVNLSTAVPTLVYDFGFQYKVYGLAFDNFMIKEPHLNRVLYSNENYDIEWIGGGAYNIKIELSTNGGQSWSVIESNYPSISNTYSWDIPQVNSNNCLVKLTNLNDPGKTATSQQFEIRIPFQFITGNSGDNWPSGSEQTISWYQNIDFAPIAALNKSGAPQSSPPDHIYVEISYSINGMEGPWISAGVVPSYNGIVNTFSVPLPSVTTDRGLFRISSAVTSPGKAAAKGSYYSFVIYSTHYFSLYQLPTNNGKLVITSPNGGESYKSGTYQTLQWRKKGIIIGSFLLEYTLDNGLTWTKINTTPVSGSVSRYNWVVPSANSAKCFVRISNSITKELYDISDNSFTIIPAVTQSDAANYPNPFNPSTKIIFELEKGSFTSLKVYNSIGQQVAELVNSQLEAGTHEFEFNATKLPSGVYYYNLTRDGKSEIHKMLLLK